MISQEDMKGGSMVDQSNGLIVSTSGCYYS